MEESSMACSSSGVVQAACSLQHSNGLAIQREELAAMLLGTASESDGSMLQQLLTNLEHVLTLANGVSADTACTVMECLKRAYTYVHTVSQDRFKLEDCTVKALDKFDAGFKRYLEYRLEEEEHQASEELNSCEQLSEEAVREARRDSDKIKEREQEESLMSLRELEAIHCDTEEILSDARENLTKDKDNLINVAEGIDELLVNLKEASDRSDRQYWEMQDELRADGFTNLCHQERLAEKRFWLKKKEMEVTSNVEESTVKDKEEQELSSNDEQVTEQLDELVKKLKIVMATALGEEYYHSQADQLYDDLVEEFTKKREDLNTVCERAETSLLIVEIMNECVQLVMEDAKKRKNEWEQQLPVMKLTNLLQLRDALMATACIHMMRLETSSEKDTDQQQGQEQTQLKGKVKQLQDELEVTDQQITALNPLLHLDTLRQRFEKQQRDIKLVLEKRDIGAAEFSSRGSYVEIVKRPTRSTRVSETHPQKSGHTHSQKSRHERHKQKKKVSINIAGQKRKRSESSTDRRCKKCRKVFPCSSALRRHMVTHTGEKPYRCEQCGGCFGYKHNLATHMIDVHAASKPHECVECHKSFFRVGLLQKHMLTHHGESSSKGSGDSRKHKSLPQTTDLTLGLTKTRVKEKPLRCEECGKKFMHKGRLQRHVTISHRSGAAASNHVKDDLKVSDLEPHTPVHTETKLYKCSECNKQFVYERSLKKHISTHSIAEPACKSVKSQEYHSQDKTMGSQISSLEQSSVESAVECSLVERSEVQSSQQLCDAENPKNGLKQSNLDSVVSSNPDPKIGTDNQQSSHPSKAVDSQSEPNVGSDNQQSSSRPSKAVGSQSESFQAVSIKVEKPYRCGECHKTFSTRTGFVNHMMAHSGNKPFSCEVCQKRFTVKTYMQKHMLTHTGDKPYECEECHRRFSQRSPLVGHMKAIHGWDEHKYRCDKCQRRFALKYSLEKHLLTH